MLGGVFVSIETAKQTATRFQGAVCLPIKEPLEYRDQ